MLRGSALRTVAALAVAVGLGGLIGATPASAVIVTETNVSVLTFETNLSFNFGGPGNPDLGPLDANGILGNGDFDTMILANQKTGPLLGQDIDPIGKVDGGLGTTAINPASTPFVGLSMEIQRVTDSTINGVADRDGFLFTIDASADPLSAEWLIVKLALKDGSEADPDYGVFVISNLGDVTGSTTLLQAFISDSEFNEWAGVGGSGGTRTDAISHLFAFGIRDVQQVPVPATLVLLGLGVVGLRVLASRKSRR